MVWARAVRAGAGAEARAEGGDSDDDDRRDVGTASAAGAGAGAGAGAAAGAGGPAKHIVDSYFSGEAFDSLPLSKETLQGVSTMGFKTMTRIQAKAIPAVLAGRDILGAAKCVI
jgi:hypothetical protein